jgi:hypothetical protein
MITATAIQPFEPQTLDEAEKLSGTLAKSALLPDALRGKPGDVLVVLLTGRELGLGPMQSLRGISVIKGKPVMNADLIVGMVLRHPEICEYFRLVESSDKAAVYETKRKGSPAPTKLPFTIEQARQAGLTGKDNWKNYPAAMLRARCSAALARAVYPDLCAGVYESGEGDEEIKANSRVAQVVAKAANDTPAQVIDVSPAPTPTPASEAVVDVPWESAPQPDQAAPSASDLLRQKIADAPTQGALTALVSEISALPADERDSLKADYKARVLALRGAA